MYETNRQMLVVYAAAALAVALIGARYMMSVSAGQSAPVSSGGQNWSFGGGSGSGGGGGSGGAGFGGATAAGASASASAAQKFHALVVDVSGAVRRPGVVRVRNGDRVGDAIAAAGGVAAGADLDVVNLAMPVADGQQVIVPRRGAAAASGASVTPAGAAAGPISLNNATADQLASLDGVGPGLAAKIVAYRTQHGGFQSLDELTNVAGIGAKRLESLRAQLQP